MMLKKVVIFLLLIPFTSCVLVDDPNSTPMVVTEELAQSYTPNMITWTDTPISQKTSTSMPFNTATSRPTESYTATLIPSPSPIRMLYVLQTGTPAYIPNFAHPEFGCDWTGVAGQIFDRDGAPVLNLVVNIIGTIDNTKIDLVSLTGIPEADIYGPGAFEIQLSNSLIDISSLSIRILNLNGTILAGPIAFNTFDDCQKNLIIINFIEND